MRKKEVDQFGHFHNKTSKSCQLTISLGRKRQKCTTGLLFVCTAIIRSVKMMNLNSFIKMKRAQID